MMMWREGWGCVLGTVKSVSCDSGCANNRSRITVHLGTIYDLDNFWRWMTAVAKVVLPPQHYLECVCVFLASGYKVGYCNA